ATTRGAPGSPRGGRARFLPGPPVRLPPWALGRDGRGPWPSPPPGWRDDPPALAAPHIVEGVAPSLRLRAGTRGSRLALWQTEFVIRQLQQLRPDVQVEPVTFRTTGDRITEGPLPRLGGKGLFTQELEAALRSGEIDFAVHSLKDLPTDEPDGLALGAILRREDPSDALVAARGTTLDRLPRGARVGTSSPRRRAQ